MDSLENKVIASSAFYGGAILDIDFKLAHYGYLSLKPYFKGQSALELGPASGYMTKYLREDFNELHIVEGSLDLLNMIPEYENVKKSHSLFEDFESVEQYDTIIMSHVLEHISDPVFVLRRIKQWLKPGGRILVAVPNAKSIHRLAAVQMGLLETEYTLNDRDFQLGHYRVYDIDSLKKDLNVAGYTILASGGYFLKPVSNGQIDANWSEEMIEGFYKLGNQFQENCAEIYVVGSH